MSRPGGIRRLLLAATAAVVSTLVVAACAIQLRSDEDSALAAAPVTQTRNSVAVELERCRSVTLEQVADIQECRRAWAENSRRFLGQSNAPAAASVTAQSNSTASAPAQRKDPGRDLKDSHPIEVPKSE
jgi:conjugative transfer region protein TrbK